MNIKETIAAINRMQADGIIDRYAIIADPLEGLSTNTLSGLGGPYEFCGFFLPIRAAASNR